MKAINLLDNREIEVEKYKNIYFSKVNYPENFYLILERSFKNEEEISKCGKYSYYKIENELYDSFYSDRYEHSGVEQLSLFDFLEEEEEE